MSAVLRRVLVCGLALVPGAALFGQATAQSGEQFPYLAALTADEFVRAGADSRYYPFGQLRTGDVVKVIGEKAGWARVATLGPAFRDFFGYISYPKTETGHFLLSADGRSGTTTAPTDLYAPNRDARFDPRSSWKPAATLLANRTLQVLETVAYEDDMVHKVKLPGDAQGWIDLNRLRPATPAEVATWQAALANVQAREPQATRPAPAPVAQPPLGRVQPNEGAAIEPTRQPPPAPAAEAAAEAPPTPSPEAQRRSAQWRLARIMLEDLEAAYARLLAEPIETAEVAPLRGLYLDLAQRHPDRRPIAQYAQTRARQLELWSEVQQRKLELAEIRARARRTTSEAEEGRLALQAMDNYVAAGRLEASIIYDGKRLPKLFRLRSPITGRTLGYLQPEERFDFAPMLGRQIGVVGERSYDGALRLTLIQPQRIDLLENED
jgi:hypothetical protein